MFPTGAVAILMLYFFGAVAARVMYERGYIREDSTTLNALSYIYAPLSALAESSPAVEGAFEWCVSIFVQKKPDDE